MMDSDEVGLRRTVRSTRNNAIAGSIGCCLLLVGMLVSTYNSVDDDVGAVIEFLAFFGALSGILLYPHVKTIRLANLPGDPRLNIAQWLGVRNLYRTCMFLMVIPLLGGSIFVLAYLMCSPKVPHVVGAWCVCVCEHMLYCHCDHRMTTTTTTTTTTATTTTTVAIYGCCVA